MRHARRERAEATRPGPASARAWPARCRRPAPSSSTRVTCVRMTFEVVIGASDASPVYSRIESTVTVRRSPRPTAARSACAWRGSRIAALPAAFAPATSADREVVRAAPADRHRVAQRHDARAGQDARRLHDRALDLRASRRPRARPGAVSVADCANARTSAVIHCCEADASRSTLQRIQPVKPPRSGVPYGALPDDGSTDVGHALDPVHVGDLRVRADHADALAGALAEVGQQLLDQLHLGAVAELARRRARPGRRPGGARTPSRCRRRRRSRRRAAPASSIGSCAQFDVRSVPSVELSRMKRVPLWSKVRYGLAELGDPVVERALPARGVGLVVARHVVTGDRVRVVVRRAAGRDQVAAAGLERLRARGRGRRAPPRSVMSPLSTTRSASVRADALAARRCRSWPAPARRP